MTMIPKNNFTDNYCTDRIKPSMLRDVKTEALLVLVRTALERYFSELNKADTQATIEVDENAKYVYTTLNELLLQLQKHVVNVDYLLTLVKHASARPQLRALCKAEEPLMDYYDIMAQQVKSHFNGKHVYLPVFLVICVLSGWVEGEEKSTHCYPFLEGIDFMELMGRFEEKREDFKSDDICRITEIHELSNKMIEKLKSYKYKSNKKRVSKSRGK